MCVCVGGWRQHSGLIVGVAVVSNYNSSLSHGCVKIPNTSHSRKECIVMAHSGRA